MSDEVKNEEGATEEPPVASTEGEAAPSTEQTSGTEESEG